MPSYNVFIRGIYSTVLTKLFVEAHYKVIYPSEKNQKRFNLDKTESVISKDIIVNDLKNRRGISITFKKEIWEELKKNDFKDFPLTVEKFPNLIKYRSKFSKNSIYNGIVVKSDKNKDYSLVRLKPQRIGKENRDNKTSQEFSTTLGYLNKYLHEGMQGLFNIRKGDIATIGAELGSFYSVPGDLIVIQPFSSRISVSRKIQSHKTKKRLYELGNKLKSQYRYGVILRTSSELASTKEIMEEAKKLNEIHLNIQKLLSEREQLGQAEQIGKIIEFHKSLIYYFPYNIKNEFNKIRGEIVNTMDFHHTIKSNKFKINIDVIEEITTITDKKNSEIIRNYYLNQYFAEIKKGNTFLINHYKLNGKNILKKGEIINCNTELDDVLFLTIKRIMNGHGEYDGLGTPIEKGDYSLTTFNENAWYYKTEYFSHGGKSKGCYFNINTPIEISNESIQYFDLEIDVIENVMGERTIIDVDLLEKVFELEIISNDLYERAKSIAEKILNKDNGFE